MKSITTESLLVRFVGLAALLVLLSAAMSSVAASSGTLEIYDDTTLTSNHRGNIVIMADNLELDCAGHSVTGPGWGSGILMENRVGVKVEGCRVTKFQYGFEITDSSNNIFENNAANANSDDGFALLNSNGNTFENNTANRNGAGFWLHGSSNNSFTENVASNNTIWNGFGLYYGSDNNELRENIASNNDIGYVDGLSESNKFYENVAQGNRLGFRGAGSSFGLYKGNTAIQNRHGFVLHYDANNNFLQGNLANGNAVNGYTLLFAFENTLAENIADNNHNIGINLRDSTYGNVLISNAGCRNHTIDALDETAGENYWVENDFCASSFTASGAISGLVTDLDRNPIPGLNVSACEYHGSEPICAGNQTSDDGIYIIVGLPPGEYRVFIIEHGWEKKIYFDTHHWEDATPVPVELDRNTSGIEFALAPGGAISGHVTDQAGNPLANMSVDLEQGWYGACTDENGYYTIEGVPLGTQNVVVGRDFCGPHGFAQQTVIIVLDDTTRDIVVDFALFPAE